jgi:hypothetical protein
MHAWPGESRAFVATFGSPVFVGGRERRRTAGRERRRTADREARADPGAERGCAAQAGRVSLRDDLDSERAGWAEFAPRARDRRRAGSVPATAEIVLVMVLAPANLVATALAVFLLWFRQMGVAACGPDHPCDLDLLPWSIGVPLVVGIVAVAAITVLAPIIGGRGRRVGWIAVLGTALCAAGIATGVALSVAAIG